jgi:hypothetical protein
MLDHRAVEYEPTSFAARIAACGASKFVSFQIPRQIKIGEAIEIPKRWGACT